MNFLKQTNPSGQDHNYYGYRHVPKPFLNLHIIQPGRAKSQTKPNEYPFK